MNKFLKMKVVKTGLWMDGGTFTLEGNLANGENVSIEIVQNMIIEISPDGKYAGQLYVNKKHVEPRSILEQEIVEGLKEVLYGKGGVGWMDKIGLADKLEYLQSEIFVTDLESMRG